VVGAKYRVEAVLGEGGMGIVVRARHLQLDEPVALKFLRPELARNADVVARFAREAKASARIKSEHIARVFDVGMRDDGVPYMVMELLHGTDLGSMVSREGPLPLEDAVDFVVQACDALAQAHAAGIVHRDIKPENLFLAEVEGWRAIKLLDFGISQAALLGGSGGKPGDGEVDTGQSVVLGTPLYMSPEQVRASRTIDGRTDIWSLGICLYELLTGEAAFTGPGVQEICAAILDAPAPLISHNRPDLPIELEAVIARCLEKDPEGRYQNVAELASALAEFGSPRARISVERSAHVIRSAGLSSPASRPASSGPAAQGSASMPSIPRPPGLPTPGTLRPSVASETPTLAEEILPAPLAPKGEEAPATGERRPSAAARIALLVAGVIVTAGGGVWIGRTTASPPLDARPTMLVAPIASGPSGAAAIAPAPSPAAVTPVATAAAGPSPIPADAAHAIPVRGAASSALPPGAAPITPASAAATGAPRTARPPRRKPRGAAPSPPSTDPAAPESTTSAPPASPTPAWDPDAPLPP